MRLFMIRQLLVVALLGALSPISGIALSSKLGSWIRDARYGSPLGLLAS